VPEILTPGAGDYTPDRVRRLFALLKQHYLRCMSTAEDRLRNCPPKTTIVLRTWGDVDPHAPEPGTSDARATTLIARLPGLCVGNKLILGDETTLQRVGMTVVYDEQLNLLGVVDAGFLTDLRTALMAALAVDLCHPHMTDRVRVGFLGTGATNVRTAWVFHQLFGVTRFVWRGSPRCRERNLADVQALVPAANFVVDAGVPAVEMWDCGVVISSTSNGVRADTLTYGEASHARVYVAQDLGWGLGPSIRKQTDCYADHPEQINRQLASHFPWDSRLPDLHPLAEAPAATAAQVSVYLHGIGLADLVVAYEALGGL